MPCLNPDLSPLVAVARSQQPQTRPAGAVALYTLACSIVSAEYFTAALLRNVPLLSASMLSYALPVNRRERYASLRFQSRVQICHVCGGVGWGGVWWSGLGWGGAGGVEWCHWVGCDFVRSAVQWVQPLRETDCSDSHDSACEQMSPVVAESHRLSCTRPHTYLTIFPSGHHSRACLTITIPLIHCIVYPPTHPPFHPSTRSTRPPTHPFHPSTHPHSTHPPIHPFHPSTHPHSIRPYLRFPTRLLRRSTMRGGGASLRGRKL